MSKLKKLITIKDFMEELGKYDENRKVAIQMIDGEYDRVGFIDEISDEHDEYTSKYYLTEDTQDVLLLICDGSCISSQY